MQQVRLFVVVATLSACVAQAAWATQSRINSMGGGVKNITVLDERNIFSLPAELVKYGSWAAIELGGPGFDSFGIHYNLNASTVMALYGSNESPAAVIDGVNMGSPFATFGDMGNTHRGTLLIGKAFTTTRVGLLLDVFGDRNEMDDQDGELIMAEGPFVVGLSGGLGFDLDPERSLDIGLHYRSGTANDEGPDPADGSDNTQTDLSALLRYTSPCSDDEEIVLYGGVDLISATGESNVTDGPKNDLSEFYAMLGADVRLNLGEHILVQPGIGLELDSWTWEQTAGGSTDENAGTTLTFPYFNLAVDLEVRDWLDIRFGGSQLVSFTSDEDKVDGDTVKKNRTSNVSHQLSSGVGFNLPNDLAIDIQVQTNWWRQGPYFLTGDAGTFGINAALSKDW